MVLVGVGSCDAVPLGLHASFWAGRNKPEYPPFTALQVTPFKEPNIPIGCAPKSETGVFASALMGLSQFTILCKIIQRPRST
jgi:hypothetical protein